MCSRKRKDEATVISKDIEYELKAENRRVSEYTQLLLLGTGESGKTTIIKQMKMIYINGYTNEEKKEKIPYIKQNVHEVVYDILYNMDKITPPVTLRNNNSMKSAEFILNMGPSKDKTCESYTEEYFEHVKILWADLGVKETFSRSNEFQLIDCAEHFLDRIDEIRKIDYIPTIQDVLFCRIKTTTISKIEFQMSISKSYGGGKAKFWMYDVGGQRGQRKKWMSVFEGINSILFLIAASDFDQTLREDETQNRLKESFQLFHDMFWSRYLRQAGAIVFLNKQDLLKRKIENGKRLDPIIFPEYKNYKPKDINDEYERTKMFMKQKLIDISQKKPEPEEIGLIPGYSVLQEVEDRQVYIHFTVATDTNNIKLIFNSVHESIIIENIKSINQ